jgi:flagellar basal-body rod protein FlgG
MPDALYIGATGMQAQQMNVDTIANNLANVNTTAFKKGRISFTDLMVLESTRIGSGAGKVDGAQDADGPQPVMMGNGVGIATSSKVFDSGTTTATGSAWDVAIQGDGFFKVTLADGSTAYTRGGTLKVNTDGQLATQSGLVLQPAISVPANVSSLAISSDGVITVTAANQTKPTQLAQLQITRFTNPTALQAQGDGVYVANDAAGDPTTAIPGQDGLGSLQQGYLEGSNVQMVDEMVNLIVAQRAYEASSKIVQASDEMMQMVNNLRR